MSVVCCAAPTVALPIVALPVVDRGFDNHLVPARRRIREVGPGRMLDAVARLGSLVTLAALLVLAGAAGGAADGEPPDTARAVTITFGGDGR